MLLTEKEETKQYELHQKILQRPLTSLIPAVIVDMIDYTQPPDEKTAHTSSFINENEWCYWVYSDEFGRADYEFGQFVISFALDEILIGYKKKVGPLTVFFFGRELLDHPDVRWMNKPKGLEQPNARRKWWSKS